MQVQGSVRWWLRAEGLAVLIASMALYRLDGGGWAWFALFLLLPDLSMLGYLAGPGVGAKAYNAVHSYAGPLLLALVTGGLILPSPPSPSGPPRPRWTPRRT